MPREAPVTSAIRSARGGGIDVLSSFRTSERSAGIHSLQIPTIRVRKGGPGAVPPSRVASTRLGEQRQLPRRCFVAGLVGERGRIVPGEAVIRELRFQRIALLI